MKGFHIEVWIKLQSYKLIVFLLDKLYSLEMFARGHFD